jgi:hypothetical protein
MTGFRVPAFIGANVSKRATQAANHLLQRRLSHVEHNPVAPFDRAARTDHLAGMDDQVLQDPEVARRQVHLRPLRPLEETLAIPVQPEAAEVEIGAL